MQFTPDLMTMASGAPVTDWSARREELIQILSHHQFGVTPPVRSPGRGTVIQTDERICAGHAHLEEIDLCAETDQGPFHWPAKLFLPKRKTPLPLFLFINFFGDIYNKYCPLEEVMDHGYAICMVDYRSVTSDDGDMQNGLAACFDRPQDGTGYGKISLWAWAMMRTLDYLLTREEIDPARVAAIGHSRLGKTALWCAAQDTRIRYCFSNDSGCAGAALEQTRREGGETADVITRVFPYWFCENYRHHALHPEGRPFDQHFLLGAIAPRYVCVNSAHLDAWADPVSEQICCIAASPAWAWHGKQGFIGPDTPAQVNDAFHDGSIGYYLRDGIHFLSRADWLKDIAFMEKHP